MHVREKVLIHKSQLISLTYIIDIYCKSNEKKNAHGMRVDTRGRYTTQAVIKRVYCRCR